MRLSRLLSLLPLPVLAVTSVEPAITGATPDVLKAMQGFKLPPGYQAAPFAVDTQLANPVAIALDEQNRVYVAETFRFEDGVSDNRQSAYWLDDDLAAQSVADRLAYYQKHAARVKGGAAWFTNHVDQIRLLVDTDRDGRADASSLFATGFNAPEDGLGSGLIARNGEVWYTNIPHLWRLKDTTGDGVADSREKLLSGFGVRTAFLGHDLHGLTFGPDGRLYWSVGDRGYNVTTREGVNLKTPGRGAVFRSEPDGSHLEVMYHGLRNPQELAFNEYGDLFTGDNNSDSGDRARIVYLMEGGDAGWNMEYQYMEGDYSRGPFNAEKVWHPLSDDNRAARPSHTLPPLMNLGNGPSGLAFAPGGSFGEEYRNHFFMCDYTGSPSGSKIWAFAVEPEGAGYKVVNPRPFFEHICNTDVEFGYDGKMYVSDWIIGWKGSGKGRVYTVAQAKADPAAQEKTRRLFAENGYAKAGAAELSSLLGHDDPRVRQRAQFTLAGRGAEGRAAFEKILSDRAAPKLARIHAMWGLGQIARAARTPAAVLSLAAFLADADPEYRVQAARQLGEARVAATGTALVHLLRDPAPRVRAAAALALGRIGHKPALPAVVDLLRENNDRDVFLRHAGMMALVGITDADALVALGKHESPSVRLAALLALRRAGDARLAGFLADTQPGLVTEAARAIYDARVDAALPALADLIDTVSHPDPALLRRVIGANRQLGRAAALARFAGNAKQPAVLRRVALQALETWGKPSPRDPVNGQWRPLPARPAGEVAVALQPVMGTLLKDGDKKVAELSAKLSGTHGVAGDDPDAFVKWAGDAKRDVESRQAALKALIDARHPRAMETVKAVLGDANESMRASALGLLAGLDPTAALPEIDRVMKGGGVREKQAGLAALGALQSASADAAARVKAAWVDFTAGKAAGALQLETLAAARASADPAVRAGVEAWEKSLPATDPVARFAFALEGGDASRGEAVFTGHAIAQCIRCHLDGGGIGPDLKGLRARMDRRAILESVVEPNAKVSAGFGTTSVTRKDGSSVTGLQKEDTPEKLVLQTGDGALVVIPRADVQAQVPPLSVMPPMGFILSPAELRDVVEFLSTRK